MRQTTQKNDIELSPIGIGTWWIWWFAKKDLGINVTKQIDALAYMFSQGCNFCEVNMWNAEWYAAEIVAKALQESWVSRGNIFLCLAIYLIDHKTIYDAQKELESVMELFQTHYIDTVQFTMSNFLHGKFAYITEWIDGILDDKKTRFTSLTNWNLDLVKIYHDYYQETFFSHEVVFNFEVRDNETLWIIPYHQKNNIKTIVYQPLRRNRTALRKRDIIESLSHKYWKTPNQIILNRINKKWYHILTKSENITHIQEHLNALHFNMDANDYNELNNYQIDYVSPPIDRENNGKWCSIHQLSNIFDEEYDKQHNV